MLAPEELDAVHVIIDAMVRMAGAPSDKMIDGGNAVFFQTVNNVIDNCKGLRRWFEGVASRYAAKVIPTARTKRAPMPYLYKSIMNDLEDYRLYVAGIGVEELRDEDASRPRTRLRRCPTCWRRISLRPSRCCSRPADV